MVCGNKFTQATHEGKGRAGAGFGIETEGSAVFAGVNQPIIWRDVIIRSAHLDARLSCHRGWRFRCRRNKRIRPICFFQYFDVFRFNVRRRRHIAAVQPHQHAGVAPHTENLRAQGCGSDFEIARLPFLPQLPMIAAAPARHNQHALLICEIVELIRLHLSFQTDCVQVHLADVAKICFQAGLVRAK